jgi:hypothetical protein
MEWVVIVEAASLEDNSDWNSLFSELLLQLSAFDAAGFINENGHSIRLFVEAEAGSEAIARALIVTSQAQTSLEMPQSRVVAVRAVDVELLAAQTERARGHLTDPLKQAHGESWRRRSLRQCNHGTGSHFSP